ncbi:MAG: hypothetical protein RLZZ609_3120, partial [Cyanobacteriota bacterium]
MGVLPQPPRRPEVRGFYLQTLKPPWQRRQRGSRNGVSRLTPSRPTEMTSASEPRASTNPLSPQQSASDLEHELALTDAWWRAANYLAVGMIYLQDNPLLKEPLRPEHIKNRLLGHWGSS